MKRNVNKIFLPLLILVILLIIATFIYNLKNPKQEIATTNNNNYILLNDYSKFFTVNSCVYRFIVYLQKEDYEKVFEILNTDFVNSNNITLSNVKTYFPILNDGNYTYVSKKIYYEKENSNIIKYYVYGYIQKELIDSIGSKTYYSYEVNFDMKNQTFDIAPYNGNLFKEESK